MKTFTMIKVKESIWAVDLRDCKNNMKPVKPNFVLVCNSFFKNVLDYSENTLMDKQPIKKVDVHYFSQYHYKEVGFWKVKKV